MRIRIQESPIFADPRELKKKQFIFLAVSLLLLYPLLFLVIGKRRIQFFFTLVRKGFWHKVITIRICLVRKREEYEQSNINMSEKSKFTKGLKKYQKLQLSITSLEEAEFQSVTFLVRIRVRTNDGSGSRRPKNIRIRIRTRNRALQGKENCADRSRRHVRTSIN